MNELDVLHEDSYLEMENYWRKKEIEDEKKSKNDNKETSPAKSSKERRRKHKRKRFEFDTTGLTDKEIEEKK